MDDLVPILPVASDLKLSRKDLSKPAAYALIHEDGTYVGSTGDLYKRVATHQGHLRAGTHSNPNLQAAFDKNPQFELRYKLVETKEEAESVEQEMLDRFMPEGRLLNIGSVADRPTLGRVLTDEQKEATRQRTIQQFSTEEARAVQAEKSRQLWQDPEYRAKQESKVTSDEQKQSISSSLKEKWQDPEYRAAMMESRKHRRRPVTIDGVEYESIRAAASSLNMPTTTLSSRIYRTNNAKGK